MVPTFPASRAEHVFEARAGNAGLAINRAFKELRSREGVKERRLITVFATATRLSD